MACDHKHIRCTNCEYFCIDCGAKVDAPTAGEVKTTEEKPTAKKGGKKK